MDDPLKLNIAADKKIEDVEPKPLWELLLWQIVLYYGLCNLTEPSDVDEIYIIPSTLAKLRKRKSRKAAKHSLMPHICFLSSLLSATCCYID